MSKWKKKTLPRWCWIRSKPSLRVFRRCGSSLGSSAGALGRLHLYRERLPYRSSRGHGNRGPFPCRHAPACPGCAYWSVPYAEQLRRKRHDVEASCRGYSELSEIRVPEVLGAVPTFWYRKRVKWMVDGVKLGLYAAGTHRVVDLRRCLVLHPELFRIMSAIRVTLPWEPLRAVDLIWVDGGVLVTWVVDEPTNLAQRRELLGAAEARATALMASWAMIRGIALSLRQPSAIQVLGHELSPLRGVTQLCCRGGPNQPCYQVAAGGFVQAHGGQEQVLQDEIFATIQTLGQNRGPLRVLELFAGSGALALRLARAGARVTAVESMARAVELGRQAAVAQGLALEFVAADATHALRQLVKAGTAADVVLVNPPRRGLEPRLRELLNRVGAQLIVYVSCDPTSLARDLASLVRLGWRCRQLKIFDMMPQTDQVESLAKLVPAPAPAPQVVYANDRLLVIDKPPHEPTTPQGEHDTSLLDRVRCLPEAARAVPVHRLDAGTSGLCLFARQPSSVAELADALARSERTYYGLSRGICRAKGTINRPLLEGGRQITACTRYIREMVVGGHSFVAVRPETGRRHQIRKHLAMIGHPLLGDERYGDPSANRYFWLRHRLDRAFLHCAKLTLRLGETTVEISSALPPDLITVLRSLAGRSPRLVPAARVLHE